MSRLSVSARAAVLITMAAVLVSPSPAPALATIQVTTTADEHGSGPRCSLREAVEAANTNTAFGGCRSGTSGRDRIVLGAARYRLTRIAGDATGGDLDVAETLEIVGRGRGRTVIDANGGVTSDRAIEASGVGLTLRGLTITGGRTPAGVSGGGVSSFGAALTLTDVAIQGNRAGLAGGGMYVISDLRATDVAIVANRAGTGNGGGITGAGTWVLRRALVRGNRAGSSGGGFYHAGVLSFTSGAVIANRAGSGGGMLLDGSASASFMNATISGNQATSDGGGLLNDGSDNRMTNVTIAGNRADSDGDGVGAGGGIEENNDGGRHTTLKSSIVAGNRAAPTSPQDCTGLIASAGHNILRDPAGCSLASTPTDRLGANPRLAGLRDNGGATPTHALRPGSPAVNRGANAGCPRTDQRGAPRRGCDIGAYELVLCEGRPVTVVGTNRADRLVGNRAANVFLGLGGDDTIIGGGGADRACGGPGADALRGGGGRDRLSGDAGADRLHGGGSFDRCVGGRGRDEAVRCEVVRLVP